MQIYIFTASKDKHHSNIFSVAAVYMYDFLQKNTKFVKYCYQSISLVSQTCQNVIWYFCWSSMVSCIDQPLFGGLPLKAS